MKQIFGMFKDLMGNVEGEGTERPGIAEKLIDVLGPQIGTILGNIRGISDNYTRLNTTGDQQPILAEGEALGTPTPVPRGRPPSEDPNRQPEREDVMGSISGGVPGGRRTVDLNPTPNTPPVPQKSENEMFLDDLYNNMIVSNIGFYENFHNMIQTIPDGKNLIDGLITGQVTVDAVIAMIRNWGGQRFTASEIQENLHSYIVGFLAWIQEHKSPQMQEPIPQQELFEFQTNELNTNQIIGKCRRCGEEYIFGDMSEIQETELCEEKIRNGDEIELCGGIIEHLRTIA